MDEKNIHTTRWWWRHSSQKPSHCHSNFKSVCNYFAAIRWSICNHINMNESVMGAICAMCVYIHMSIDQTSSYQLNASCRTLTAASNLRLYNFTLNHTTNTAQNGTWNRDRNMHLPSDENCCVARRCNILSTT